MKKKNDKMSVKKIENNKYEFFDVTADIGFKAYGETLEEAYINASKAMFNVISDTRNIKCKIVKNIEIISEDEVALLYDYLSELLFLSETELILFSCFKLSIKKYEDQFKLIGEVKGENMNWSKHKRGTEVKAVTYHLMKVEKEKNYKVQVILDL